MNNCVTFVHINASNGFLANFIREKWNFTAKTMQITSEDVFLCTQIFRSRPISMTFNTRMAYWPITVVFTTIKSIKGLVLCVVFQCETNLERCSRVERCIQAWPIVGQRCGRRYRYASAADLHRWAGPCHRRRLSLRRAIPCR